MKLELLARTDLAVRALRYLDGNGRRTSEEIAAALGSSSGFVPQVLSPLVAAGWVDSLRGPNGGYQLDIGGVAPTMLEVIEAVEGPTSNGTCVLRGGPCPAVTPCALHDVWEAARAVLVAELDRIPALKEKTT